jgi:hypothetical protein
MIQCRLQASAELASPQEPRGNIPENCTLVGNPKLIHLFLKSLFHFSQILFFNQLHKGFEIKHQFPINPVSTSL